MTREDVIEILRQEPSALRFLDTTPERLAAMAEVEFGDCAGRAAEFLREASELQKQAAKILRDYAALKSGPCLVSNLAHRAQRLRDMEGELGRVQRVLREQYFSEV